MPQVKQHGQDCLYEALFRFFICAKILGSTVTFFGTTGFALPFILARTAGETVIVFV
jgi:hypothetical protein